MPGIWITREELMALPTTGGAWSSLNSAAASAWGSPKLNDQNSKHGLKVLAGAYVSARTNDAVLANQVRTAIIDAKRTMDASAEWGTSNGVLALGRTLPAYIFAADLVPLAGADATEFSDWLRVMQTQKIGTHGRWNTLRGCHEDDAANWAAFAGAARVAIAAYLGDGEEIDRCAAILRAVYGERGAHPSPNYFNPSSGIHWSCGDASTWTGINGPCVKNISGADRDLDGGPVIDLGDAGLGWPPGEMSYPWECFQGWMVQTEILHRLGHDSYNWSDAALKRGISFMARAGWSITNPARHVIWVINARYGTTFPTTSPNVDGRAVTWTDWTHAVGVPVPPDPGNGNGGTDPPPVDPTVDARLDALEATTQNHSARIATIEGKLDDMHTALE